MDFVLIRVSESLILENKFLHVNILLSQLINCFSFFLRHRHKTVCLHWRTTFFFI